MNKFPQITLYFWIMKICATTLGETAGDLLSMTLKLGYSLSSMILGVIFVIALAFQFKVKKYYPFLYWAVILLTSTVGTTMSDYMDRTLHLGYATGSLILISLLLIIFTIWHFSKLTFAVEKINTLKGEALYWIAILFSNTLGTALGDFLSDDSGLGFAGGALLIGSLLALIACAKFWTSLSTTLLFWFAFVLTRPFGATMGDFLTKPIANGGCGLGTIGSSGVLFSTLLIFVFIAMRQQRPQSNQHG